MAQEKLLWLLLQVCDVIIAMICDLFNITKHVQLKFVTSDVWMYETELSSNFI